jgi:hypothetical protein
LIIERTVMLVMKRTPWTEDELIELSALVSARGTALRAAAKFKRSITELSVTPVKARGGR